MHYVESEIPSQVCVQVNQVPLSMGQERNEFSQVKSDPDQSNSPSMVLQSFTRLEPDEVTQHSALSITSSAHAAYVKFFLLHRPAL